jgi:hypothetical protein
MSKKIILANFQKIIELFTQKIVNKLSKICVWYPGFGKNISRIQEAKRPRIPDPRSRIRNTDVEETSPTLRQVLASTARTYFKRVRQSDG